MRKPIAQEDEMGCGVACLAFILDCSYVEALRLLKFNMMKARALGVLCKDLVAAFRRAKLAYQYRYIKRGRTSSIYKNGTIVFIKRSKRYPAGHYLCRYKNQWMDPWINFINDNNIHKAKAGFRKRLPGRPIYVIRQII